MKKLYILVAAFLASSLCLGQNVWKTEDIHIRDPFILPVEKTGVYYMYRTSTKDGRGGVEAFKSRDLKEWTGPVRVLDLPEDNWITGGIWAPEVHKYKGGYYLFATINTDIVWKRDDTGRSYTFRGTQIFRADSPEGPFKAFAKVPHTPMDEMALDGTFWLEDGQPYMVYCHEWVQTVDGEMKAVKLKKDLSEPVGQPVRLFNNLLCIFPCQPPSGRINIAVEDGNPVQGAGENPAGDETEELCSPD